MDKGSRQILEQLISAGFEAYYVGGCVRDALMGNLPKDIDICTSALPSEVLSHFERAIPTGIDYGTVTVIIDDVSYEVTTFRQDLEYNGRRPKVVRFSKNLIEDLSRRDFTINAIAMDINQKIIDPFNGQRDIQMGILRFVGTPLKRLKEDKLRLLRYVRFLTRFNLVSAHQDEELGWQLNIESLSFERIQNEFSQMLCSSKPSAAIEALHRLRILEQIFPEVLPSIGFDQKHPAHLKDVYQHTLMVLDMTPPVLEVRLAALCHDLGKPATFSLDDNGCGHFYGHQKVSVDLAETFLERLKYSNRVKEKVLLLTKEHMRVYTNPTKPMARRLIQQVGAQNLNDLFSLQTADTSACAGDRTSFLADIEAMRELCRILIEEAAVFGLKDLKINGNDLVSLGLNGIAVGAMLRTLLNAVTDEKLENDREVLLQYVKSQCVKDR